MRVEGLETRREREKQRHRLGSRGTKTERQRHRPSEEFDALLRTELRPHACTRTVTRSVTLSQMRSRAQT
eukprot:2054319-Rhodomonas_salina.1